MKFFRDAWPVVVIVATVAGAAWTAAWNLRDFLAARIATSETGLAARIATNETGLAAQIAASENRLAAQIATNETGLAAQIATNETGLAAQIATNENRLAAQIVASENRLVARIAAGENRLAAQIAASENRLAENDAHLAGQIAELRQYLVDHLGDHAGRGATPALARGAMLRTEERTGWTQRQAAADDECPRGPGADADDHRRRHWPCPDIQPADRQGLTRSRGRRPTRCATRC